MSKFYEVVFEGHYEAIIGYLEGFTSALPDKKYKYFVSEAVGIKEETLLEVLKEWVSLKSKLHHVILDEEFYKAVEKAIETYNSQFIEKFHIKSAKEIKSGKFEFKTEAYGRRYGEEIKKLIANIPSDLTLTGYEPKEVIHEDAKEVELYTPDHDYSFKASAIVSGAVEDLILFKEELDKNPLIETEDITLDM